MKMKKESIEINDLEIYIPSTSGVICPSIYKNWLAVSGWQRVLIASIRINEYGKPYLEINHNYISEKVNALDFDKAIKIAFKIARGEEYEDA